MEITVLSNLFPEEYVGQDCDHAVIDTNGFCAFCKTDQRD